MSVKLLLGNGASPHYTNNYNQDSKHINMNVLIYWCLSERYILSALMYALILNIHDRIKHTLSDH